MLTRLVREMNWQASMHLIRDEPFFGLSKSNLAWNKAQRMVPFSEY